ncbi:succinate dehydrogenase, cytochrome b556 subunit [Acidiferrobacter thiooxydans]|jgi:succinate dehydrogenase / fumarate reductase cytochrome b subunit|uniref:Succinate dehydrogenase cytochrome b556 subunit n=1 Tax=Acidiferrobacter thiooxydans TaxID=163359 RepID=A0A1C2G456_9GAMM|nr:succinate dehydrogenase, cytochrome b556 subunit [Acidiferrobacter thiooxydans]MDA8190689.1 succinate dehydrogenase, cytochrome b556 subunit [Gammaproteobacteria bacterium]RCN59221.1 succinate dehydrogenase, cytochrome b556 subunit [Acidiferrobacter thiooxydans]UEO00958.1 succinate dehydrogenase, cytochrome b556 subunit [Acidiferrobacter thiooxydans]
MSRARPQDLGLRTLRLPVGAWASLLHRITGVLLIAVVGLAVGLLRTSLQGPGGFQQVANAVRGPWGHVIGPLAILVAAEHLYSGMRHLAHDVGWGFGREHARLTAGAVMILAVVTALAAVSAWP